MKYIHTLGAEIREINGCKNLVYNSSNLYSTIIAKAPLGKYVITIDNKRPSRSLAQNNYLWGIVYPTVAEEGEEVNDLHLFFKDELLPKTFKEVRGRVIEKEKSTKTLSKNDFALYIKGIERITNILIPKPCEVGYSCGRRECDICSQEMEEVNIPYPENNLGEIVWGDVYLD